MSGLQKKYMKARNRREASELRSWDTSTLFFIAIISATHKPVQSGPLKPVQLAQAGGRRSSHRVCERGQNACGQVSPRTQPVKKHGWENKTWEGEMKLKRSSKLGEAEEKKGTYFCKN